MGDPAGLARGAKGAPRTKMYDWLSVEYILRNRRHRSAIGQTPARRSVPRFDKGRTNWETCSEHTWEAPLKSAETEARIGTRAPAETAIAVWISELAAI